jgi:uncharacterized protein YijF (DUF1287 family)
VFLLLSPFQRRSFAAAVVHAAVAMMFAAGVAAQDRASEQNGAAAAKAPHVFRAEDIVAAARGQIGKTTRYDPAYVSLTYPGGDVAEDRGVCSDVVIRALRKVGIDLQKEVHEDMAAHFGKYPKLWGLKRTDRSIDHRRVPNLARFFERRGKSLPVTADASAYLPGDFVVCRLDNGLIHIMTVSDRRDTQGTPLIIHNIGSGAQEEARLFEFKIEGHYRWFPPLQARSNAPGQ